MSYTWSSTVGLSTGLGSFTASNGSVTGTGTVGFSETAVKNTTTVFTIAVDVSAVKALGIKSTGAVTCGINDAASGSPDATITLAANKAIIWVSGDTAQFPSSNPLGSTDVVTVHVTNASTTTDATVTFACLVDVTP